MSLQKQITEQIKQAMKAKDAESLEALRAIKSAILLEQTQKGNHSNLSEEQELKLLQKLVKQRKDSALLFNEKNREDLAKKELSQARIIEQFLPKQLDEAAIKKVLESIIKKLGAKDKSAMGKVMGAASKELLGKANGKTISKLAKRIARIKRK